MPPDHIEKIKNLKSLILDVDGVLTNGGLYLGNEGEHLKRFHIHDGLGIQHLQKAGLIVAIISSRHSDIVTKRMTYLGIKDIYQGYENKLDAFSLFCEKYHFAHEAIAYMGDDLPDLPVLEKVGFKIAPANAVAAIKNKVDWVTKQKGGYGAVREVCDQLIQVITPHPHD